MPGPPCNTKHGGPSPWISYDRPRGDTFRVKALSAGSRHDVTWSQGRPWSQNRPASVDFAHSNLSYAWAFFIGGFTYAASTISSSNCVRSPEPTIRYSS